MNFLAFFTSAAVLLQLAAAKLKFPPCQQQSKDGNFLVSIKKFDSYHGGSYFHQCTGSVISPDWVLTAANCVYTRQRQDLKKWRVSANELNFLKPTGKEQTREVKRMFLHAGFHGQPTTNDIALIQLKTPLDFSTGEVTPVCLADYEVSYDANNCKVAGWGLDMEYGKYIPTPQTLASPVYDDATCRKFNYSSTYGFCFRGETRGFCRDDINRFVSPWGSPMFCPMSDGGKIVQVGMVNWGGFDYPCFKPDVPPLFTKIKAFRNWIYIKTLV